jgi:hypothetical protein
MGWLRYVAVVGTIACASGVTAGGNAYADPERDCQSAATLLARGSTPTPLWRLRACPARAGELLAQLLRDSRVVTDSARLEEATWLTQYVHDAHLVAAGVEVSADSQATPEARVAALRVLLWSKAPGHHVSLRTIIDGPVCIPPRCRSTFTSHFYRGGPVRGDTTTWPVFGMPMPRTYVGTIDSVASFIEASPNAPVMVQRAARTVNRFPPDPEMMGR